VLQYSVILLPVEYFAGVEADAVIAQRAQTLCAIKTADCLPILITNHVGNEVAAIHAGWKGLVAGVIQSTLAKMNSSSQACMAWIGPAICKDCFEVGPELKDVLMTEQRGKQYFADLPKMAELILRGVGVNTIFHSNICTMEELRCDSYRREKGSPQRMISVISFS
jgi:YfiH family protein